MSSLSLEASIRTCKVDTAWDVRAQSDRFFNPNEMVCPVWGGTDLAGRLVCPDSFNTKTAGCNSALDRALVENELRPQYMEYVNLSAAGYTADIYGSAVPNQQLRGAANVLAAGRDGSYAPGSGYGNFGLQMKADVYPGCQESARASSAANATRERFVQANQLGYNSNAMRQRSGF